MKSMEEEGEFRAMKSLPSSLPSPMTTPMKETPIEGTPIEGTPEGSSLQSAPTTVATAPRRDYQNGLGEEDHETMKQDGGGTEDNPIHFETGVLSFSPSSQQLLVEGRVSWSKMDHMTDHKRKPQDHIKYSIENVVSLLCESHAGTCTIMRTILLSSSSHVFEQDGLKLTLTRIDGTQKFHATLQVFPQVEVAVEDEVEVLSCGATSSKCRGVSGEFIHENVSSRMMNSWTIPEHLGARLSVARLSPKGVIEDFNSRTCELFKSDATELRGKKIFDFLKEGSSAVLQEAIIEANGYGVALATCRMQVKDVEELNVRIHIFLVDSGDEGQSGSSVLCHLIPMESGGEKEMISYRLDDLNRLYFEHAPIAIFVTNDVARYIDCNKMACTLSGYSREEILSMTIPELSPGDDLGKHKECQTSGTVEGMILIRRKDGVLLDIELRGYRFSSGVVVAFCIDVTQVLQMQRNITESERKHRMYIESAPTGIFVTNGDGQIVDANPAAASLCQWSQMELLGMALFSIVKFDNDVSMKDLCAPQKHGVISPTTIQCQDGSTKEIEFEAILLSDDRFMGWCSDISEKTAAEREKIELEERYRQSQKMEAIGNLAGGIAHDFNNILTIILGSADIAKTAIEDDEDVLICIQDIINAATSARNLTGQLLHYSRKRVFQPKRVDANVLLHTMERMLRLTVPPEIVLSFELISNHLCVLADPIQIEQAMLNLVVNARDAMPNGGSLTISTGISSREDFASSISPPTDLDGSIYSSVPSSSILSMETEEYVCVCIKDTGEGMDPSILSRIFEPYFTTKVEGKGTGLGLSGVHDIMRQHNGFISVSSEVDIGTTMSLFFPRVRTGCSAIGGGSRSRKNSINPHPLGPGSATILFVDDDPIIRRIGIKALERNGFNVLSAENGAAALKIVERCEKEVDVLMTDVMMPQMNGPDLAQHIKRMYPKVRIIFASGFEEETIFQRQREIHEQKDLDDDDVEFLAKPYTPSEMLRKIQDCLFE